MYMGNDAYYCGMDNGFCVTLPYNYTQKFSKFVSDLEKSMSVCRWIPKMTSPTQNIKKQVVKKQVVKEIRLDSGKKIQN